MTDTTAGVVERHALEKRASEQGEELLTSRQHLKKLERRQKTLLEANDELATTNAELRGAIQDLSIQAERAALASENTSTLNEEITAVNEHLQALNEELEATNEELTATNAELRQRGAELETLGKSYDERLANLREQNLILRGAAERLGPIVVLDEHGEVVYCSIEIADTMAIQGAGWKTGTTVTLGDEQYFLTSSDVTWSKRRYSVIEFHRAEAGFLS